jgi:hypothetical protein
MTEVRLVADRRRGSKRKKRASFWKWLCNPQVLRTLIAGARLADSLARLAKELVRIIAQH